MITRRNILSFSAGAAAVGLAPKAFAQQTWPQKPVTIICPFAAGGNTDGIARMAAQRMTEAYGTTVNVENRPGAGGAVAADFVAKAAPDGYTLLIGALPVMAIVPAMQTVRYDSIKDFAPISNIATNPFALVVNKDLPIKTLADFVAYVKARPDKLSYSSAGVGSLNHLSMALFLKRADLQMAHVPYRGNAPALADVVAGHVPAMFSNLSDALPQINGGAVRLLAVSSEGRSALAPDAPTVAESGYPGFNVLTWNGLMAPARTPTAIIEKIADTMSAAIKDEPFRKQLADYGVDPLAARPAEFAAMLKQDMVIWKEAVDVAGVKQQ
jgi:tripartite-type tricarboxylate transporter receptor subunit TctC